jgi:hypothetical protein
MSGLYFSYLNNSIIDLVKAKPLAKQDLEHLMYLYCEMKRMRHYAWPSTAYLTCVPGKTRSMISPCREWPAVPAFPAVKGGGHEVYLPAMGLRANIRTLWAFGMTPGHMDRAPYTEDFDSRFLRFYNITMWHHQLLPFYNLFRGRCCGALPPPGFPGGPKAFDDFNSAINTCSSSH